MNELLRRSNQNLPYPSPFTSKVPIVSTQAHCHGCGKIFEISSLLRCSRCKRVYYCSQACQKLDFLPPRHHKSMCQEGLLELALSNLHRLPVEQKMLLLAQGKHQLIPNHQFCQTVAKVTCPGLEEFLVQAKLEFDLLREHFFEQPVQDAYEYPGNTLSTFVEGNRYGLDVGVESLVAAINLWPNVHTVNSCSGVHKDAWVPTLSDGGGWFCEDYVKFVSDDRNALNQVSAILENGAVGICFHVGYPQGTPDSMASKDGFLVVDYKVEGMDRPNTCRTYCRSLQPTRHPFDKLDNMLWALTQDKPAQARLHMNLVGLFGTALKLVLANPNLSPSETQQNEIAHLQAKLENARKQLIDQNLRMLIQVGFDPARDIYDKLQQTNWWDPKA